MNKIEEIKREKDGLDIGPEIATFAQTGWEAIPEGDIERLKWHGVFFRRPTPGYFMMRIRITNGITGALQLRTIADISRRLGGAILDITTRQQIQLRWLEIRTVPGILERLQAVDLTTLQTGMDNIRNVVGCPVAGITREELFDASPVARAFTAAFVGNRAFTNLPRKFNVTITGCRESCTHSETQDIALTPAVREGVMGFNVAVGGKLGSGGYRIASPLDAFITPEEAVEACSQIVFIFRDHGPRDARNKVRLAFLIEDWGVEKFRLELTRRLGRSLPEAGEDARRSKATDHVGIFREKAEGLNYVGLKTPVGRLTADQLDEVARLSETYGVGEVRLTPSQNVIIPHVPDRKIADLTVEPLLTTLRYDPSEVMRGLVACTGTDFCNLAVIETKGYAMTIARDLEKRLPGIRPITVHWSGCPAGCGNHHVADIGLQGTKAKVDGESVDAVNIFVGGKSGPGARLAEPVMQNVPVRELPRVLESLLRYYPRRMRSEPRE
jgi:ferredoxin-nitrite reductase